MASSPPIPTFRSRDSQEGRDDKQDWADSGAVDVDNFTNVQETGEVNTDMQASYEDADMNGTNDGAGKSITAEEVRGWDEKQTADHLRQIGVDPKHCQAFEDQEITGDLFLEMDQNTLLSQDFNIGAVGKRLKTYHKIQEFQRAVQNGTVEAPTGKASSEPAEEVTGMEIAPFKPQRIRRPYQWKDDMAQRLKIQETSNVQPAELLDDLEPKWMDQYPSLVDAMTAMDRSREDIGQILSNREGAKYRSRLSKEDPHGVERATQNMVVRWLEMFNGHRDLSRYRPR
jgi:SAM domain (Sterile alpha motif)